MKIKATKSQVAQIAVNAIKASTPMGMGWMHYNPNQTIREEDIKFYSDGIEIDYFSGRMVKLSIKQLKEDVWNVLNELPKIDYQSWAGKYPTCKDLVSSVKGVEILE